MKEKKEEKNHKTEAKAEAAKPKAKLLERLFGGINLSWPKLIAASVAIGVFVGILMTIPALTDTSFTRIGVIFYWWVLFGTIIITNSKNELDSAFKCFIFFLISQPLIYLAQILIHFALDPAKGIDWSLFNNYGRWFEWTLATFPFGLIGFWLIKRRDIWSIFALAPAMAIVLLEGVGEFSAAIVSFPKLFISGLYCAAILIVMTVGILKGWKLRSLLLVATVIVAVVFYLIYKPKPGDFVFNNEWEVAEYGVTTEQEWKLESDFGERLTLEKADNIGDDGKPTGEQYYYVRLGRGDGYDVGHHEVRLISPTETKNCAIDIEIIINKIEGSFSCE